jgi:hypothetical protein
MTPDEIRAMKSDLDVAALNFRELLSRQAHKLMLHRENAQAGALFVFERLVYQHAGNVLGWYVSAAPMATEDKPAKRAAGGKRAPKGQGAHRHKFNEAGKCACGAERQRAPKGSAKPLDAAARTAPLPLGGGGVPRPIGDDVPDKFDGGAFGSSSARERG